VRCTSRARPPPRTCRLRKTSLLQWERTSKSRSALSHGRNSRFLATGSHWVAECMPNPCFIHCSTTSLECFFPCEDTRLLGVHISNTLLVYRRRVSFCSCLLISCCGNSRKCYKQTLWTSNGARNSCWMTRFVHLAWKCPMLQHRSYLYCERLTPADVVCRMPHWLFFVLWALFGSG
jgi:hypothetical protein